jgi:hypothetical protein
MYCGDEDLMPLYPRIDERFRPSKGRPRGDLSIVIMSGILKDGLARRDADEAAGRPHKGPGTSEMKFDL